jgi:bifunctional non-homologous end joining protein LigD
MAKPPKLPLQSELDSYRSKRTGGATPEPMASVVEEAAADDGLALALQSSAVAAPSSNVATARGARMFVVHEHHATRNHFDLRLEIDGVLISWAIPHGPSMNPDEKRLAVKVEAHPLEYANFEAVIPPGNYGAGPMICWDRGRFAPVGDPAQGVIDGEVKFELHGYKLRGAFTLVHTGKKRNNAPSRAGAAGPQDWLLIKKRDIASDAFLAQSTPLSARSVLSGLTVQDLQAGANIADVIQATIAAFKAPKRPLTLADVTPMLCQTAESAFSDPAWLYELKYDGYRGQATAGMGHSTLRYRSGQIATERFPEIASALRALPYRNLILDGELVFFDHLGKPDFQKLAARAQLSRASEILRASVAAPVTYVVFDLLAIDGYDLRTLPLHDRKALLSKIVPTLGPLKYAEHIVQHGEAMLQAVAAQGLEGVVAKRAASPYRGVRHVDWQKLKIDPEADFAICGYTPPKGSRAGLGALHLCIWHREAWLWAGKVGTGFNDNMLVDLRVRLEALPPWKPTFAKPQGSSDARWITPGLVCQVRYREWPVDHALRFPVFERLRPDKAATECTMPKRHTGEEAQTGASDDAPSNDNSPTTIPDYQADIAVRELRLSNPKKVYWPKTETQPAILKGQLIEYYRAIAPWILPYLRDRPTVLTRFPDGIEGNWFYQKDMPDWTPPWLRTVNLWSEGSQREIHYLLVDDEDGLAYLANLGSIPIHSWASTTDDLERPTWTIIDLDPKGAPREHVVPLALAIHELCESIGLPNYVKTSGQTGLHVMMPLAKQCTYDNARNLALLLSSIIEQRMPTMCTTNKNPRTRGGKVFLDWGQNAHGQLLVAPFSVRPIAGAPVSMPLRWHEVTPDLDPAAFHIGNAVARMRSLVSDPCLPVLSASPVLTEVMAKLETVAR